MTFEERAETDFPEVARACVLLKHWKKEKKKKVFAFQKKMGKVLHENTKLL
jgi:hypothetical protein